MQFDRLDVYLETGKKNTFAAALEWPGWCRSGRDEDEALQSLLAYGPRYARVLRSGRLVLTLPTGLPSIRVVGRVEGNSTTDFGAPAMPAPGDDARVGENEMGRLQAILEACWEAFDGAVEAARGKALRKGPRGGGRELEAISRHLTESDQAYLRSLGWKAAEGGPAEELSRHRTEILRGLASAAAGEIPKQGPRGGSRWSPRYFVRRVAWHTLDHTWEIEDRIE